ncbi:MAG TPA: hypothetical protein PKD09_09190 [Aggregatilinea sp.]|uniref:hypothetical protein n=1 Tax=Aggregatilinea sp. TaxID=2806333 RepID=UPI002BBF7216|nr:hypothetical protein [Aggregatilinea sp.]HML21810.1 hypothetical protein [Aggregatilinea sp.]
MGAFPESGLAAVLDLSKWSGNVEKYLKDSQRMNQSDAASEKASTRSAKSKSEYADALKKALDPTQKLTGSVTQLLSSVGAMPSGLGAAVGGLGSLGNGAVGAVEGLSALGISVSGTTLLLGAAAVAAVAAGAALFSLGMRGAAMPGVIQAFDITSAKAGMLSATLLGDLRAASRGTVADMTLMKSANLALAGATQEVAQALGPGGGLAGLMNIARAQARATGQDVDFLFQSLVSGVKRSSPMLIDNTGLVLKLGEANEKMAKSLGKSVEQLTASEKQIAILNATLEAGQGAVETYGNGPLQASERIAQIQTQITNLLDRMALSIQPIFNFLLAIGQTLLSVVIYPIQNILLPIIYEVSNAIFGPLTAAWETVTDVLGTVFAPVLNLIHRWLTLVISVVRALGTAFQWVVRQIGNILKPVANIIKSTVVEPIAKLLDPASFAKAGGAVFGAFAQGIMAAANQLIFPTVIAIAQFIRDFLMGFSPPKEGPLKTIDEGGYNVMAAWMEGFTGVPLTPVDDMAAKVDAALGDIGKYSYQQVQDRIAALDKALQPFIDNLELAKAKMDAIVEPLKEAQDAIQKRLDKTVKAFFAGEASDEMVRSLDRQNEAIADQIGLYEDMSSEAQYQLSMAKARQAVERALLTIQSRRVEKPEETAAAVEKVAAVKEEAAPKEKKGSGAADLPEAAAGGGGGWEDLTQSDPVGSFMGVTDEDVSALWGDITGGFSEGFDFATSDGTVSDFQANIDTLKSTMGEIGETTGFQKLTNTFENVFGDGPDSIKTKVSNFVTDVNNFFTVDIPATFDAFSLDNLTTKLDGVFGWPDGSLYSSLDTFETNWTTFWAWPDGTLYTKLSEFGTNVSTFFTTTLPGYFDGFTLDSITTLFTDTFGNPTAGIQAKITDFETFISGFFGEEGTLGGILKLFSLDTITGVWESAFGSDESGVRKFLNDFKTDITSFFSNGPGGAIFDALSAVGGMLSTLVLAPLSFVANGFIAGFYGLVNGIIKAMNTIIRGYNWLPLGGDLEIGEIDELGDPPVIGDVASSKTGAYFAGGGLAKVHQGEVLASAAGPFTVFPARWVNAMETIADRMSYAPPSPPSYEPIIIDSGGMNISQTFTGRTDAAGVKRSMYELQALGVL